MVAHPLTVKLARENKTPVPEPLKQFGDTPFALADDVELWLPGGGHTQDNIVVWLTGKKVLFGGCFLKSTTSTGLGNIADAVMQEWSASVVRTRQRYSDASMVVPGHGTTTGDPIGTTLELLERDRVARKQGGK